MISLYNDSVWITQENSLTIFKYIASNACFRLIKRNSSVATSNWNGRLHKQSKMGRSVSIIDIALLREVGEAQDFSQQLRAGKRSSVWFADYSATASDRRENQDSLLCHGSSIKASKLYHPLHGDLRFCFFLAPWQI